MEELDYLVDELDNLITKGVEKSCEGLDTVGVIFSGGIDSVLVAKKAQEFVKVKCFSVGFADSVDPEFARISEKELNLDLTEVLLDLDFLEDSLSKVVKLVGEPNPLAVGVGVPMYLASKYACDAGLSVMLCGQGADELFGGYWRYVDAYVKEGGQKVLDWMESDVDAADADNLDRDRLVTSANNIELRFPFLLPSLVEYSLDLPLELRVREVEGGFDEYECVDSVDDRFFVRKYILRKVAERNGLPKPVINRRKKAAQYGSSVNKNMERLARKRGFKAQAAELGEKSYVELYLRHLLEAD